MNKILRDLINEEKVVVFVDDVLVWTKTEDSHDEIVKEILKRLEENDLYVKPENCVWKARKIEFLGVIIEPNGIEIKVKKVDRGTQLARTEKYERHQKVFRSHKLL